MKIINFEDGVAINGDSSSPEVIKEISKIFGNEILANAIVTDPPYGNLLKDQWDKWDNSQRSFVDWMISWTNSYSNFLVQGGAMYIWGGYGTPKFRPFFEYAHRVEEESSMKFSNFITWSKKRAYGVQHNYLSTREELIYLVKGDIKKPAVFNIPLLDTKRGYGGYDPNYPAKSEFYRRTNVWMDITEIFSGKVHVAQKPVKLYEIPIEVNTKPEQWVIDPFAGSMTCAFAARNLGRKWVCIERDEKIFNEAVESLKNGDRKR